MYLKPDLSAMIKIGTSALLEFSLNFSSLWEGGS